MDKGFDSGGESNRDQYLKQLNKLSHKISKPSATSNPIIKKPNAFDHHNQPPPPPPPPPQQQHQPPVYNINKNDFRDVVQKLTGSPAHDRFSNPPLIQQPKPASSRLHRIRPPPLAHVSNRPPHMLSPHLLSCADAPVLPPADSSAGAVSGFGHRPAVPLSPLPPFPAVHAAAESPVSAYMRYLQNSISSADPNSKPKAPQFSGFHPLAPLVSPRWNNSADTSQQPPPPPPTSQQQISQPQPQFPFPPSPLPFGCLNSPRSPSPFLLFSPTSGQLNLPLSPTVPVPLPSPRWRSL